MAEPVTLVSKTIPFSFPLAQPFPPPPHERVLAKLGRQAARLNLEARSEAASWPHHLYTSPSLACRGFGLPALLLCVYCLAAAVQGRFTRKPP